jgi:hypothetical protein
LDEWLHVKSTCPLCLTNCSWGRMIQ